jgi:hypothetical protein
VKPYLRLVQLAPPTVIDMENVMFYGGGLMVAGAQLKDGKLAVSAGETVDIDPLS